MPCDTQITRLRVSSGSVRPSQAQRGTAIQDAVADSALDSLEQLSRRALCYVQGDEETTLGLDVSR
jgi:hypothetical protein